MVGPSHGGLGSSRWVVSPAVGPNDENTHPTFNRVASNHPQVQANVHDRVATMTARRPAPMESVFTMVTTQDHHNKPMLENLPTKANAMSKYTEEHKAQDRTIESPQGPRGQVHAAKVQSAYVQPSQALSVQTQAAQTHPRLVQEAERLQVSSQTNHDEQCIEEGFIENLKKGVERISAHNQELESKRIERSARFKLEDARGTPENHAQNKQGADVMAPKTCSRELQDHSEI